jgi:hypothetical protein
VSGLEDLASRTLRLAVRALPRDAAGWGRAMVAELAAIDDRRERRRFMISCLRAVLTCRPAVRAAVPRLALVGYTLGALWLASGVGSGMRRAGAIMMILGLTAGCAVACGRLGFGPAGHGRLGRWVRGGGLAVIGAELLAYVGWLRTDPSDNRPVALVAAAFLILGVAMVRLTAARSSVTRHALRAGLAAGLGAAALWTAGAVLLPDMPSSNTAALASIAAAGAWAALLARSRPSPHEPGLIATLAATAIAAHVIYLVIAAGLPLSSRWVANNAPPVIGPHRLVDPVGELAISLVLAALVAIVVPARSRSRSAAPGHRARPPSTHRPTEPLNERPARVTFMDET